MSPVELKSRAGSDVSLFESAVLSNHGLMRVTDKQCTYNISIVGLWMRKSASMSEIELSPTSLLKMK